VAIVTGGTRGIGRATVDRLAADGYDVVYCGREERETEPAGDAMFVRCDVGVEEDIEALVCACTARFGPPTLLVNNAGVNATYDATTMSEVEWERFFSVDLKAAWLCAKHVLPHMVEAGGGAIVNVSSTEGMAATLFCGSYTASKFGVRGITKAAALEYAADNIRANSVHPGGMDTPMTRAVMDEQGRKYVASKVPMKRMGTPEDVANVIAFLASADAAYCTGAEVLIDGGVMSGVGF
jgi:3alpha(or 20beta)-hydroxysteroid dehydrogenase